MIFLFSPSYGINKRGDRRAGARDNRGRAAGEDRAGSGSSKNAGIIY